MKSMTQKEEIKELTQSGIDILLLAAEETKGH